MVAGLDPSAGAGLAADLRALAAAGAWGCPVVAVITVQSTAGLVAAHPVAPAIVAAQIDEVLVHHPVRVIKTGALGSAANVRAVTAAILRRPRLLLVVDPVLTATRAHEARLLDRAALAALRDLCAHATVVTPNAREAEVLTGKPTKDLAGQERAARALVDAGARAALVKGGHLGGDEAIDVLATRSGTRRLRAKRLSVGEVHGTGCTLASLIAGRLALRDDSPDDLEILADVRWAKRVLTRSLARAHRIGEGMPVLAPR